MWQWGFIKMLTTTKPRRQFSFSTLSLPMCIALALLPTTHATAQQAGGASSESTGLDEVVVTARRREESLSEVPASIVALGAKQLEAQGIVTQSDLQSAVPGLTVRQTQGSNSLTFAVRGQTIDAFTGS